MDIQIGWRYYIMLRIYHYHILEAQLAACEAVGIGVELARLFVNGCIHVAQIRLGYRIIGPARLILLGKIDLQK